MESDTFSSRNCKLSKENVSNMRYNLELKKNVLRGYKKAYKNVKLVWLSPSEFLRRTRFVEHHEKVSKSKLESLQRKLIKGVPLDPLQIVYYKKRIWGIQGRHRALASKSLGIKKVPVLLLDWD